MVHFQFTLCYQTIVCLVLSVTLAFWPNGWVDQDTTYLVRRQALAQATLS